MLGVTGEAEFREELDFVASYSENSAARTCALKHELGYVQRWKSPEISSNRGLGSAWHAVMECFYEPDIVVDPSTTALAASPLDRAWRCIYGTENEEQRDTLINMFTGYLAFYPDDAFKVRMVEESFGVELPRMGDLRIGIFGRLDLLIQPDPNERLWVWDHKTSKRLPSQGAPIDDQLPLYVYALTELGFGVVGGTYNYARSVPAAVSTKDPTGWANGYRRLSHVITERQAYQAASDAYKTLENRYLEQERLDAREQRSPASRSDSCKYRCDFERPCLRRRSGRDLERALVDYGFERKPRSDRAAGADGGPVPEV